MDQKENQITESEAEETAADTVAAELTEEIEPEENPAALENVLVDFRVELTADKISLRELQNLRAGQIITLGCRPTDPVRLVTDNSDQPVAIGELVDVEGRLGIRLTRVLI